MQRHTQVHPNASAEAGSAPGSHPISRRGVLVGAAAGAAGLSLTAAPSANAAIVNPSSGESSQDGLTVETGPSGTLPATTPALIGGAYTTQVSDLEAVCSVTAGTSTAMITLLSAATAGAASVQYVRKADTGAGQVIVTDGVNQRAWLSAQYDIVMLRSNGTSWEQVSWQIAPLMVWFNGGAAGGPYSATVPPLAVGGDLMAIGSGGGGGSGRQGARGSLRTGAGGGAGGSSCRKYVPVSEMGAPGQTLKVTVGAGGAGGAAQTTASTNGNGGAGIVNPANGGSSANLQKTSIVNPGGLTLIQAWGGGGGGGGGTAAAPAGVVGVNQSTWGSSSSGGSSGTAANPAGATIGANYGAVGAGSAGGGATAANAVIYPLTGTVGSVDGIATTGGSAVTTSVTGGAGNAVSDPWVQIGGGGGAGGFYATGVAGTAGGAGASGSGGGGGAAADNGLASGAGGQGGDGEARIVWHFA